MQYFESNFTESLPSWFELEFPPAEAAQRMKKGILWIKRCLDRGKVNKALPEAQRTHAIETENSNHP